jgi:transposase
MLLKMKLRDLRTFAAKINVLEQEIENLLLQTDGRLLLTVPDLGVTTAAELYAEIGDVFHAAARPKIRSPFHIFKKRYFRNSGLFFIFPCFHVEKNRFTHYLVLL